MALSHHGSWDCPSRGERMDLAILTIAKLASYGKANIGLAGQKKFMEVKTRRKKTWKRKTVEPVTREGCTTVAAVMKAIRIQEGLSRIAKDIRTLQVLEERNLINSINPVTASFILGRTHLAFYQTRRCPESRISEERTMQTEKKLIKPNKYFYPTSIDGE